MNQGQQWDIFCKVIDNFGDIGVCWRLAADLASSGQRVRLWVDDASALAWMAPAGCDGVQVLAWNEPLDLNPAALEQHPADILVEAFGCEIAPEFIAACAHAVALESTNGLNSSQRAKPRIPLWINLEYLSAESYVERCHALPSPVQTGPAAGWTKWFFYPGFTELTGGLLRETDLAPQQADFDSSAWLAAQGLDAADEKRVSLFCYEPDALASLLKQFATQGLDGAPVHLLVAAGRASHAVKTLMADGTIDEINLKPNKHERKPLSISYLPLLTQADFDALLWTCDLNFVRGEDSLLRAIWAGKPFVWQIYPQADAAHLDKLNAFLQQLQAPPSLQRFHAVWNHKNTSPSAPELPVPLHVPDLPGWQDWALATRTRLTAQDSLSTRLLNFVAKKR